MKNKPFHKINHFITNSQLRIIGEGPISNGLYDSNDIFQRVTEINERSKEQYDVVEISDAGDTSICRVIDYKKFLYELKIKEKAQKKAQPKNELKTVKMGPNISNHDLTVKINHMRDFLNDGHEVKVVVMFSGRDMMYTFKGENIFDKILENLSEDAKVIARNRLTGNQMILSLMSSKKK